MPLNNLVSFFSSVVFVVILLINNAMIYVTSMKYQPQRKILPTRKCNPFLFLPNKRNCIKSILLDIRGGDEGQHQSIITSQLLSSKTSNDSGISIKLFPAIRLSLVSTKNKKDNKRILQIDSRNLSKFDLCTEFQCSLRDIRNLISDSNKKPPSTSILSSSPSAYSSSRYTQPAFLIRDNYIILHFDFIRVVIQSDFQVFVFLSDYDNSTSNHEKEMLILQQLVHKMITQIYYIFQVDSIQVMNDNYENDPFLDYNILNQTNATNGNNGDTTYNNAPTTTQFQLIIFDVLLSHISSQKSSKADILTYESNNLLYEMLPPSLIQTTSEVLPLPKTKSKKSENFLERQMKLGQLLILKNKVDKLISNCEDLSNSIADLLKNEDDMLLIVSLNKNQQSGKKNTNKKIYSSAITSSTYYNYNNHKNLNDEEYMNVELLLEDYLLQFESIKQYIQTIQSYILNTEEVLNIELDYIRNRIMQYEVFLSIFGLVIGMAAAVTGLFGMNLLSHLEFHPNMFWNVTFGLVVCMFFFGSLMVKKLMNENIW